MKKMARTFRKNGFAFFVFSIALLFLSWPILSVLDGMSCAEAYMYIYVVWGTAVIFALFIGLSVSPVFSADKNKKEYGDGDV
ncbi:MAG: hypothetical protein PHO00_07170 [bacterium]|nr:hypothetical protein [bacterium]